MHLPPSFIIMCLYIRKWSCWQTNTQITLKTSNALRYAVVTWIIMVLQRSMRRSIVAAIPTVIDQEFGVFLFRISLNVCKEVVRWLKTDTSSLFFGSAFMIAVTMAVCHRVTFGLLIVSKLTLSNTWDIATAVFSNVTEVRFNCIFGVLFCKGCRTGSVKAKQIFEIRLFLIIHYYAKK